MSKIHMHILDQVQVIYSQIFYSKTIMITHTRLTALFRDYPGEPVPER